MDIVFKFVIVGVIVSLAPRAQAQSTIVQWGALGGETDIVAADIRMDGGATPPNFPTPTFVPNSDNNPTVGANYYPNATGRTPIFSAAGARITPGDDANNFLWQRQVKNDAAATNGDRFVLADQTSNSEGGATKMHAMVVWEDENWLNTTDDTLHTMTVEAFRYNTAAGTTGSGRFIIENGDGWFASETVPLNPGFQTRSINVSEAGWVDFTPMNAGVVSIGGAATPSFTGVESVGYYFESASSALGNLGAFVRHFGSTMTTASTGGPACDGDTDGDCDLSDLDAMYAAAGNSGAFDFTGNGTIGPEDLPGWLAVASTTANSANPNGLAVVRGDVDLDFDVDSTDLGSLLNNFGANAASPGAGPGWGGGDVTMDGKVDSTDLGRMLNEFGSTGTPPSASSVPEPSSAVLILLAVFGLLGLRRRA